MTPERIELEQEIIWSACYNPDAYLRYSRVMQPEFFSVPECREEAAAMQELANGGVEINPINVANITHRMVKPPMTAPLGMADLNVATKRLTELCVLDRKSRLVENLMEEDDAFRAIEQVNFAANEYASLIAAHSRTPKSVVLATYLDTIQRNSEGNILRVPTGFPTLDRWCHGGLKLGNMSFLGGSPAVGKTSFMLKIGDHVARTGHGVTFLEGEMPTDEILTRLNGMYSKLPVNEVEAGHHIKATSDFCDNFNKIPYMLQTTFERNVSALMSHIREAVHSGSKLIIVDYLQVFVEKGGRAADEFTKIKALSEMIRKLTLVNNVHIMAASSLNRIDAGAVKPTINSFYGGSQLGHDCNTALILYNAEDDANETGDIRIVTCDVTKNRGGRTGPFKINYNLPTQDMSEHDEVHVANEQQNVDYQLPLGDRNEKEPFF